MNRILKRWVAPTLLTTALLYGAFSVLVDRGTAAAPAQVILIRHAEKPEDPDALHLSEAGVRRAEALVSYVKNTPELTRFGLPVALFATDPTKRGRGQRPGETLRPLASDLDLEVQTPYQSDEYKKLAHAILHDSRYDGKCVLICWTHEYIPKLAGALGVRHPPHKVKDDTYNRVYLITYEGRKAHLEELKMPKMKER